MAVFLDWESVKFGKKQSTKVKRTLYNTHFSWANLSKRAGKGAMRLTLCEAPTHETRPDHYTGNSVPYSLGQVCGFFNVPY